MTKSKTIVPEIDFKSAEKLVAEMMAIPGKSSQEAQVMEFLRKKLRKAGVPDTAITVDTANKKSPLGGEVGNLIVKLPGTVRAPRRLLMAHLDTVPLCVGSQPVKMGNYYHSKDPETALGGDDRAGASVVLNAILEIKRHNLPHPPLTLFWPVQEEVGLYGARFVSKGKLGNPKLCFNWDGGDPNLVVIGATGDYAIDIEIEGIASHAGGHPEEGVSAIGIAGIAINDLIQNGWHGLIIKGRNAGTSNIGIVFGGDATNVVTPKLTLKAEARSHDPKFRKKIVEEFRKAFEKASRHLKSVNGKTGQVRFKSDLKYEAFLMPEDEPCVRTALAAVEAIGMKPGTRISNGGLDANWMVDHGLPTVTLGCGQEAIHTVNEKLHIKRYLQACRIGLLLATGAT
jgi:tripeptide aminopeptidase